LTGNLGNSLPGTAFLAAATQGVAELPQRRRSGVAALSQQQRSCIVNSA